MKIILLYIEQLRQKGACMFEGTEGEREKLSPAAKY